MGNAFGPGYSLQVRPRSYQHTSCFPLLSILLLTTQRQHTLCRSYHTGQKRSLFTFKRLPGLFENTMFFLPCNWPLKSQSNVLAKSEEEYMTTHQEFRNMVRAFESFTKSIASITDARSANKHASRKRRRIVNSPDNNVSLFLCASFCKTTPCPAM